MWEKLHQYWKDTVPPVLYFLLFAYLTSLYLDFGIAGLFDTDTASKFAQEITSNDLYKLAKDVGLTTAIPLFLIILFLAVVFLIERFALFIGKIIPPSIIYHGNPELFVDKNAIRTMWMEDGSIEDVRHIENRSLTIIDEEKEKGLSQSDEWRDEIREDGGRAYRVSCYAKLGLLWFSCLFAYTYFDLGGALDRSGLHLLTILFFVGLLAYSIVKQVKLHLAEVEATIFQAINILIKRGVREDRIDTGKRLKDFDFSFQQALDVAPRFIGLNWVPGSEFADLRRMFFGTAPNK
ncbi:MAG: hypothetical protein ABW139_14520 [Candidatus Thiodiazotropha sp. DIVDIV]